SRSPIPRGCPGRFGPVWTRPSAAAPSAVPSACGPGMSGAAPCRTAVPSRPPCSGAGGRNLRAALLDERPRTLPHVVAADGLREHREAVGHRVLAGVPPQVRADLADLQVQRAQRLELVDPLADPAFEGGGLVPVSVPVTVPIAVAVDLDDLVDQPHPQGLLRAVAAAQQREFLGLLLADLH